jgi:hypothetical protein
MTNSNESPLVDTIDQKEYEKFCRIVAYNGVCSTCNRSVEKMYKCSKCLIIRYCSKECQTLHWEVHKKECKPGLTNISPEVKLSKISKEFALGYSSGVYRSTGLKDIYKLYPICLITIVDDYFFDHISGLLREWKAEWCSVLFPGKNEVAKLNIKPGFVYAEFNYKGAKRTIVVPNDVFEKMLNYDTPTDPDEIQKFLDDAVKTVIKK